MALEYINRKGDRYYVFQGTTKTGKPKYYCSRKPHGIGVESLPADFEIYEHPRSALVSIRKTRPSPLTTVEAEFLKEQIRKYAGIEHFIVDRDGDSFVIYVCDCDSKSVDRTLEVLVGPNGRNWKSGRDWLFREANYSPAFRLTLTNESDRLFGLERWCYRGSIDNWIQIPAVERPLDELAAAFFRHLGKESYFDLM